VQIVVMHHVLKFFIHTWHMHGYRFAVLKVAYPPKDNSTGLIMSTCKSFACILNTKMPSIHFSVHLIIELMYN